MRRKSRELALQLLFQSEFSEPIRLDELIRSQEHPEQYSADIQLYAKELVRGVQSNKNEIDSAIQAQSAHWKIDRMATIDRNLLRLAIYEMKFSPAPLNPAIAINEALEIAKVYSGTESTGFINGLLDQIAKSL